MRTLLYLTLFASFVLLSGALPPRAESTRTQVVACATVGARVRQAEVMTAPAPRRRELSALVGVREPVVAPRAPGVARFLLHRALLN